MKKLLFPLFFFVINALYAQKTQKMSGIESVCFYHQGTELIRIPPPKNFSERGRTEARAKFNVKYTGFSDSARVAFQRAVDIWESILISPVTINIDANWSTLRAGVLGSARAADFFRNPNGAIKADTWYPIALAEKIAGRELNKSTEADIIASFSSSAEWYYGTDGNVASNKYDLVTVVLHEIGHGLGFSGLNSLDTLADKTVRGSYGFGSSFPSSFDSFISDANGKLMTEYPNNSNEMFQLYTSEQLYFKSDIAKKVILSYPQLYAPTRFNSGSSISHLDPVVFPTGTTHSLMSPSIASGVSVHDPGALTMGMFADMGWVANIVRHEALKNLEEVPQKLDFKVRIQKDTLFDAKSLVLHFSDDEFKTKKTFPLTATTTADEFLASVVPANKPANYQYFFTFNDTLRQNRFPAKDFYKFSLSPDTIVPLIVHEPITFALEADQSVEITAKVTDERGIKSVNVEYSINGETKNPIEMKTEKDNNYKTSLVFGQLAAGDEIRYRIVAVDSSKSANIAYSKKEFHVFKIEGKQATREMYSTTFDSPNTDFIGSFKIEKPEGFNSLALHSPHPYQNAGDNNEINYIHQLKFPIKVADEKPFIQFEEVVLVEPSEPTAKFGGADFYDYVVVEGSKDNGASWFSLDNGYDSRAYQEWLDRYNSQLNGQNSEATGLESLYKKRLINLQKRFKVGDEILIRFRLFSDPFAFGWGWAIDNLEIQTPNVGIEKDLAKNTDLRLYPNPSAGNIVIEANFSQIPQRLSLEIFTVIGEQIHKQNLPLQSQLRLPIAFENIQKGIYIFKIKSEKGEIIRRVVFQ